VDLSAVSARVESAADSTANGVAFCEAKGYISPQTHFTVLLPEKTWRGGYLQQGCGGFCGHNDVSLTDPSRTSAHQAAFGPLGSGELVVAADDQGHEGTGALWAKEDPMLRVVFGYRSEHDLAQTAKAIIGAYYGRAPAFSYFDGVSDGGHEALALAQRYPRDFDGILAGAPAHNWAALLGMFQPWLIRANVDAQGHQILDASKLPALHAAVRRACADARGVIADPRACTFDPATLQCPSGIDRADCLTPAQANVVRALYRGPTWRGYQLFDGGEPYGSELSWQGWMIGPASDAAWPGDTIAGSLGLDYLRYMAYWRNPPASFTLPDVEFTPDAYERLEPLGRIYNATSPDLRAFRAHGRQADALPRMGRSGDLPVVDAQLLRGRRPRARRLRGHAAVLAPVHDPRPLPLSVRPLPHGRPGHVHRRHGRARGLGPERQGTGHGQLPGERPVDRNAVELAQRPAVQSARAGAAQQRPQQQLPLHRSRERIPPRPRTVVPTAGTDPGLQPQPEGRIQPRQTQREPRDPPGPPFQPLTLHHLGGGATAAPRVDICPSRWQNAEVHRSRVRGSTASRCALTWTTSTFASGRDDIAERPVGKVVLVDDRTALAGLDGRCRRRDGGARTRSARATASASKH
jgi:hypothetical protein